MFSVDNRRGFVIYSDTNEVQIGDRKVKLTPKEMGVLELLNNRSGTTVSRTELLEKVWGNKFSNDQGLTQAVSRLRRIFSKSRNVTIKTIPKKGYLLHKEDFQARGSGLGWIKINANMLLIMLLLLVISMLIFIKRIDIRVDKIPPDTEEHGLTESK